MRYLFNMAVAFLLYPFSKWKFKGRKIFLVGGNAGELYVDNGRAIYEYLNSKKELEVYWIINKDSVVADSIKGMRLNRGSIKSYLYFMNSKVVLFSHSISADIVPYLFAVPLINSFHYKVKKVFLNHGSLGLKKRHPMRPKLEKLIDKLIKSYDINTADAEFEKRIKNENWGIDEKKIHIIGSPRYDDLIKAEETNSIFFMPTWRNWIKKGETDIKETDYFKNITGLLNNQEFQKFLEKENLTVRVYIHQLMHEYFEEFEKSSSEDSKNVVILPKDADINREILMNKALITDYSSIAFDFFYMDKPVLFFQFDQKEYLEKVGAYMDFEKDLFGDTVFDIDGCRKKIEELYSEDFHIKEKYENMKSRYYKYIDTKNSERLYKVIEGELKW